MRRISARRDFEVEPNKKRFDDFVPSAWITRPKNLRCGEISTVPMGGGTVGFEESTRTLPRSSGLISNEPFLESDLYPDV